MTVLGTYNYDALLAGENPETVTDSVTILAGEGDGEGNVLRGTILGKIIAGAPTGAAGGGNTGNATLGSITNGVKVKAGVYTLTCISTATAPRFEVVDPNGAVIGVAVTGVAFTSPQINFTLTAGGTGSALNDTYTVTVAAGSEKYRVVHSTNTDGSANAVCVVSDSVVVPSGSDFIGAAVYLTGKFNPAAMAVGSSDTVLQYQAQLQAQQIYLTTNLPG